MMKKDKGITSLSFHRQPVFQVLSALWECGGWIIAGVLEVNKNTTVWLGHFTDVFLIIVFMYVISLCSLCFISDR